VPKDITDADIECARQVLRRIAPSELPVLQELARRTSWRDRLRSGSLGYGWTDGAAIVTPYAILACTWARSVVLDEAKEITERRLRSATRRLLRGGEKKVDPPSVGGKSVQSAELEEHIVGYAIALGLDSAKAKVLGRAVLATLREQGVI